MRFNGSPGLQTSTTDNQHVPAPAFFLIRLHEPACLVFTERFNGEADNIVSGPRSVKLGGRLLSVLRSLLTVDDVHRTALGF